MPHYADVVLPLAVPGAYTYRISPTLGENLVVGSRVVVPLGKSKRYTGIVIRLHDGNNTVEAEKIKDIEELVDEQPLLLPQQIELWRWMAQYYLLPWRSDESGPTCWLKARERNASCSD